MCLRKAAANIRIRNISRLIPRRFFSFVVELSSVWRRSCSAALAERRWASFGLIPEFIGRLPVVSTLDALSEDELLMILTDPKNAMVKQYAKLMAMDGVGLTFTKDALRALAIEAVRKGTGARALRALLERIMLDVMFDSPGRDDIAEITINRLEEVCQVGDRRVAAGTAAIAP